jgi:hypothetical protein
MFSLLVWMEACMNTSKIRVFYARLEIFAFLKSRLSNFWVSAFRTYKSSISPFFKSCQKIIWATRPSFNSPPSPPSKSNHERVRLNFYRWPLGWVKEWLTIYYGTQSTGKKHPWNQTSWSRLFLLMFSNPGLQLALLSLISDLKFTFLNNDAQ